MPSATKTTQLSPQGGLPVGQGLDELWKYQLRREHAELLNVVNETAKIFQQLADETKAVKLQVQKDAKIIQERLQRLALDDKDDASKISELREEIKEVKARLLGLETNLEAVAKALGESPYAHRQIPSVATAPNPQFQTSNTSNVDPLNVSQLSTISGVCKSTDDIDNEPNHAAQREDGRPNHFSTMKQSGTSIAEYASAAAAAAMYVSPEEQQDLAVAFISGLDNKVQRRNIVDALQMKGLSKKTRKRNRVEILCGFGEIEEVMVRIGLVKKSTLTDTDHTSGQKRGHFELGLPEKGSKDYLDAEKRCLKRKRTLNISQEVSQEDDLDAVAA